MHDVDDYPEANVVPGLIVYRYDSAFFANAEDFGGWARAAVKESPTPVAWFVLNTEAIVGTDITALDALEPLRGELTDQGIVFALARFKQDLPRGARAGRPAGADRRGPPFPDAAHGRRGLPPVVRRRRTPGPRQPHGRLASSGARLVIPRAGLGRPGPGSRARARSAGGPARPGAVGVDDERLHEQGQRHRHQRADGLEREGPEHQRESIVTVPERPTTPSFLTILGWIMD